VYEGYVSQLTEKSGQANNATQATAAKMPLWVSNGQNGIGSARFNIAGDRLNVTYTNSATETVFGVAMSSNPTFFYQRLLSGNNDSGNIDYSGGGYTSGVTLYSGSVVSAQFSTASLSVLSAVFNGASSGIFLNSASKATGNVGNTNPVSTAFAIGDDYGSPGSQNRYFVTAPLLENPC
jgi:hypothetical protein